MKKFFFALCVLLLASTSASAWPQMVVYPPVAAFPVPAVGYYGMPVVNYFGAPALVSPGFGFGSTIVGYRARFYAYGYPGYIPGQPVRNLLRAAW